MTASPTRPGGLAVDDEYRGPVLVVNCGSASVVAHLVEASDEVNEVFALNRRCDEAAARELARAVGELTNPPAVIGHRIVYGGGRHAPELVDDRLLADLWDTASHAPLHDPPALTALDALRRALPSTIAVACFDAAFHRHLPEAVRTLPLPEPWRRQRRETFGFHGPGHRWAAQRTAELLGGDLETLCLVTVHIGGGASAAAIRDGVSIDTTMGPSPLGGMVMGTRSGSLDPMVVLDAVGGGRSSAEVADDLNQRSGMLGVSGTSSDVRVLYAAADAGDDDAALAVEMHVRSVRAGIAAMTVALPRLDAVTFTGGAGGGSARLRHEVCAGLGTLGVALDDERNRPAGEDALIHAEGRVPVATVAAREELVLAHHVRAAVNDAGPSSP